MIEYYPTIKKSLEAKWWNWNSLLSETVKVKCHLFSLICGSQWSWAAGTIVTSSEQACKAEDLIKKGWIICNVLKITLTH